MSFNPKLADPERALSLAYAPRSKRAGLAALWRLDERLGGIVASTSDPMVGAIRLAWWREALEKLDLAPPPAEPLLQEIAEAILPLGVTGADLAEIEAGWAALLEADPLDEEGIARHGRLRGGPLFAAASRLLTGSRSALVATAGEGWALADLGFRLSDAPGRRIARSRASALFAGIAGDRWPKPLRPLGMLATLARRDALLPADRHRRQGSPLRLLRAMRHWMTGR
jgi:15-cis-phytoene synthase